MSDFLRDHVIIIDVQLPPPRRPRCPWFDVNECASAAERDVAGVSDTIAWDCPVHNAEGRPHPSEEVSPM